MEAETSVRAWAIFFEQLAKILVVTIPAVFTYFIARYNANTPARHKILEEQLTKVFAPNASINKMVPFAVLLLHHRNYMFYHNIHHFSVP